MASQRKTAQHIDDNICRNSSISRGTFMLQQDERDRPSLRQHKTVRLAGDLKEFQATGEQPEPPSHGPDNTGGYGAKSDSTRRHHINSYFHNFRYLICILGGTSIGLTGLHRYNLTIAILSMVNQTRLYLDEYPDRTVDDFLDEGYVMGGEFNWNNEIIAIILAWYMFSYTLPQTLAAKVCDIIGSRLAVPISLSICSASSLLTPAAAYMGWQYLVVCRLINGFGASGIMPASLALIENWMGFDEISLGLSLNQTLYASLIAMTPLLSGYLTAIHWTQAFYIPSLITLVFCCFWLISVSDRPEKNWLISKRELDLLEGHKQLAVEDNVAAKEQQGGLEHACCSPECDASKPQFPSHNASSANSDTDALDSYKPDSWLQILTVPSFYAYLVVWSLYCSTNLAFMFVMPAYMRQFLKVEISENGFYCFIIEIGAILSAIWPHQVLQLLQKRFGFTVTQSSHASYLLCCSLTAFTFIYVGTFHQWQIPLLFINRAMQNANDTIVTASLMSNYARAGLSGLSYAVMNTIGNLSITGVSTLIGWWLDKSKSSPKSWQAIYTGLGVANLVAFVIFVSCIDSRPIKFKNKGRNSNKQNERSDPEAKFQPPLPNGDS